MTHVLDAMVTVEITKTFVGGFLRGITISDAMTLNASNLSRLYVGRVIKPCVGGSPYRIDAVTIVGEDN